MDKVELDQIKAHFPADISQDIKDYADNVALVKSRYLMTSRINGVQLGYCTHCKKVSPTLDVKHNKIAFCAHCNSECFAKDAWRGRKRLFDRAYFVWYQKSLVDPDAIVATGYYVQRDYAEDYKNVQTKMIDKAHYVFKSGEPGIMIKRLWRGGWEKRKSIISLENLTMQNVQCTVSEESIKKAVKNTPFQYSMWEKHCQSMPYRCDGSDRLKFFEMYSRSPCIEYLTKIGLGYLVKYKLEGDRTYRSINWQANELHKVLRLSKEELRSITKDKIRPSFLSLHYFQQSKKEKKPLSLEEAIDLTRLVPEYSQYTLETLREHMQIKELYRYLSKQERKNSNVSATFYKDYLYFCKKLNMDLTQEALLFPTNLKRAHDQTLRKIKILENKKSDKKIFERLSALTKKYEFQDKHYLLRPAKSTMEIIDEGNFLKHCVGTYANSYADGKTDILFIREINNPDVPHFTVEVKNNQITQVYGAKNKKPTGKALKFVNQFKQQKLVKKKNRKAVSA